MHVKYIHLGTGSAEAHCSYEPAVQSAILQIITYLL